MKVAKKYYNGFANLQILLDFIELLPDVFRKSVVRCLAWGKAQTQTHAEKKIKNFNQTLKKNKKLQSN